MTQKSSFVYVHMFDALVDMIVYIFMCGFIHHALDAGTLCDRSPLPYDPHCDILIEAMRTQELWQIDSEL